jgi:hypothetical protein
LDAALQAVRGEPRTALEIAPLVHGGSLTEATARWWILETLCYLTHLEQQGALRRDGQDGELWQTR